MEAKLSSRRIMSAACLETSDPVMPMATPEGIIGNAIHGSIKKYLLFGKVHNYISGGHPTL